MGNFNAGAIEATLELDRTPFSEGLRIAREQGQAFAREKFTAQFDADTSRVGAKVREARRQGEGYADQKYVAKLDVDEARARAKIAALEAKLVRLAAKTPSVQVDADTAAAQAQLAALQAQLELIDHKRVSPDVSGGVAGMTQLEASAGGAGFALNGLIATGFLIGPALIPGIAGATAALGAFVSMAAAAGGGVGALAGSLVGNIGQALEAQEALTQAQEEGVAGAVAAAAAQDGVRTAAQGVQDAERALADARLNAAAQVAGAEGQLAAAQERVRRAQEALNQARADARQRLEDMGDSLRGIALDEESAELALRRARLELNRVLEDPAATKIDRDAARLAYQRAEYQLDQTRKRRDDMQASYKEEQRAGVKGSREVTQAQQELADAREGVAQAEQNLANARRSAARTVANAQRAVARAQEQVAKAQQRAAEASATMTAATDAQREALGKLDGPAQQFLATLAGVKTGWGDFLDLTDEESLGVASHFLETIANILPDLAPAANAGAEGVERLLDGFDSWVSEGNLDALVDFIVKYGPDMIELGGSILGNLIEWFGGVADAFAPFALEMFGGLDRITQGWADWAKGLDENPAFDRFIDYVREDGPKFLEFLGSLWDALVNIGRALAPAGGSVLEVLTAGLDAIADMDPQTLGLIAGGIAAIAGALMIYTGGGAVVGAVLLIAGLNTGLSQLAETSPVVADALDRMGDVATTVFGWLKDEWQETYEYLEPKLHELERVIAEDFIPAWDEFWPTVEPIVKFLVHTLGDDARRGLGLTLDIITGSFEAISGVIESVTALMHGDWQGWARGQEKITRGVLGVLEGLFEASFLGRMVSVVRDTVDEMGGIWWRIQTAFANPVNWVIDNVLNRLIEAVNSVANALGHDDLLEPIEHVTWGNAARGKRRREAGHVNETRGGDQRWAGGGVLPGWTPGQDVHHFTSPTAGDLHLSGGESIMVPEWTALNGGPRGVAAQNKAARAAARYGRFAGGGVVWPVPGQQTGTYPNHDGVDINRGAGWDDYGDPIRAYTAGRVTYVGWGRGYGDAIFIDGDKGPEVVYGHTSAQYVAPGVHVAAGDLIGRVGNTGNSSAPHLHFGVPGGTTAGALALLGGAAYPGGDPGGAGIVGRAAAAARSLIGGTLGRAVSGIRDILGDAPGGEIGSALAHGMLTTFAPMARDYGKDKLATLAQFTPLGALTKLFDAGGMLEPGQLALNLSDKPEPVLTGDQWALLRESAVSRRPGDGITREDIERLIEAVRETNPIVLPGSDDVGEMLSALAFELRAQGRGGARR